MGQVCGNKNNNPTTARTRTRTHKHRIPEADRIHAVNIENISKKKEQHQRQQQKMCTVYARVCFFIDTI